MPSITRGWCSYTPSVSGWADMSLKCDGTTASNNGAAFTTTPPVNNFWPMHRNSLRAVYGVANDGSKDSCIALSPTGSLFALNETFQNMFGTGYTVNGLRQERFRSRELK